MLQIDSILLDSFFKENKDFFENARVQKIQQPTRRDIIFHLRKNGESRKFYININPQYHHLCFINSSSEKRRNIIIPKQPPMFCMLLRKHLEGSKIFKINKPEHERIIELYFENYNELGDKIEECLSIELMGKHSNIILYNADTNIILGCAHNIGAEKSKERELSGGLPYIYPPKQDKKDFLKTRFDWYKSSLLKSDENIKKTISLKYFSLSQVLIQEICENLNIDSENLSKELDDNNIQKLFIALHEFFEKKDFIYSCSNDFERYSYINNLGINYENVNSLIDDYYSVNIQKNLVTTAKSNLSSKVNKELKKLKNLYQNQKKQMDKKEKFEMYLKKGNLLTSNSYQIKNIQKFITLKDFETSKDIEIELDETKTIIENAQRYFSLYNKGKKAFCIAQQMSEETLSEIKYYEQILYDIENSEDLDDLKEIQNEIAPQTETTKILKEKASINIENKLIDGFTVYIGKNSRQNDYLYSKISSPNDMWFHTLNTPGSHVILKVKDSSAKIKDTTILKIAKLAKEFSSAKNSTKIPVVYTLRKYIKRPQNTKSGFVVYKNETEIVVN